MSTEFNELLSDFGDDATQSEKLQHAINEFYVKRIANDRIQFTPIIPALFSPGKYMSVLLR